MDKINSKKKGSKFERTIAKAFTKWTGYEFSRSPQSGALRWKSTEHIASDVVCTDPKYERKWNFIIECKSYKDIRFEQTLLENKTAKVLKFWNQAKEDAARAKKLPILIMRYNGMPAGEAFFMVDQATAFSILRDKEQIAKLTKPRMAIQMDINTVFYIFLFSDIKSVDITLVNKAMKARVKELYK